MSTDAWRGSCVLVALLAMVFTPERGVFAQDGDKKGAAEIQLPDPQDLADGEEQSNNKKSDKQLRKELLRAIREELMSSAEADLNFQYASAFGISDEELFEVLAKSNGLILYSLDPAIQFKDKARAAKMRKFHGWPVLGATRVFYRDKQKMLQKFTYWRAARDESSVCFAPRHGIRATYQGVTVDIVVCFQCTSYRIYSAFEEKETRKVAEDAFDELLKEADVPLAPKIKDE